MKIENTLVSELDSSVNFVYKYGKGFLESRFVQREPEYFTCYLSSHSGCTKSCKFCHLTTSNQKDFVPAGPVEMLTQARAVLQHYKSLQKPAKKVYFSFMARGEPFSNAFIRNMADDLFHQLGQAAKNVGLKSKFCISTIMPVDMKNKKLEDIFSYIHPTIYYSLYSTHESRRQWMPAAMDPLLALTKLADWQKTTGAPVKIHSAIIKDFNDDYDTWDHIVNHLASKELKVSFNLVKYNPPSPKLGEGGDIEKIAARLRKIGQVVKIKDRVGFDVKASCGMFV